MTVVEIKSTNWDRVKGANRKRLLASHQRQVWKYVEKYLDRDRVDVCAGIIYLRSPSLHNVRSEVEQFLNNHGLQVVWFNEGRPG